MKPIISSIGTLGLLSSIVLAGSHIGDMTKPEATTSGDGFEAARRPISNPTLFDLALPSTNIHALFVHHALPSSINTTLGNLPLGGEVDVYALQLEYALNDRLSIVATKDGYVDVNPNNTLSSESGFANIGAGLKYAFILDPVSRTALSGTAVFEIPTGDSEVFQGEGDGAVNLIVSGLKLVNDWQFAGGLGVQIPFSDEQSTKGWMSAHASYEVCDWFIPLVELNWFHVIKDGDGAGNFPSQVGGAVPSVVKFEGGDFFNLGAVNASDNPDFVSAAFGFRSRLCKSVDAGFAYEVPLTNQKDSLMKNRITLDLVWNF